MALLEPRTESSTRDASLIDVELAGCCSVSRNSHCWNDSKAQIHSCLSRSARTGDRVRILLQFTIERLQRPPIACYNPSFSAASEAPKHLRLVPRDSSLAQTYNQIDLGMLPPHLEYLLTRLQSFDARTFYIRFGHEAVVTCTHCRSLLDYLFFHISKVSLAYVRAALLITVMTIKGSGKRKWRRWGLAAIIGAWLYEVWTMMNSSITIPRNGYDCEMVCVFLLSLSYTETFSSFMMASGCTGKSSSLLGLSSYISFPTHTSLSHHSDTSSPLR